jgi:hypothetical protein
MNGVAGAWGMTKPRRHSEYSQALPIGKLVTLT